MKEIFCANCQEVTPHKGEVDQNGEYVFYCQNEIDEVPCGRFVKFPSDVTKDTFDTLITKHSEANVGQINIEAQEKKLEALLSDEG